MSNATEDVEAKRALVAERLRQVAIYEEPAPLSFAQQRLWFLDQLEPDSPLYNIGIIARFFGSLDMGALERALNAVIARHEALRTRFICPNEAPEQVIDSVSNLDLTVVDLSLKPCLEREQESQRLIRMEVNRPFNLSSERLLRVRLHRLSATEHQLVLILHHIVADEWSLHILFRELDTFYRAEIAGKPAQMPALPIQYSDFAVWQRGWLQGENLAKLLAYWRQQLGGKPPITELPTDRPRRISPTFRGGRISRPLDPELTQRLKQLAADQEATLFMVLLAAFKVLVHRYTQQQDLIIGSPIAGRTRIETEPLIGFFVNTLPLRTSLANEPTFPELLGRVRETTLGAYAHQDLPFERMVEELQPERSLNHMPFTKVMFVLQNSPLEEFEMANLRVGLEQVTSDLAKFELTLAIKESARGLLAHVEYNSDLFDEATIARLLGHYETLLRGIVSQPGQCISRLPLLTAEEEQQLLVEWNDTRTDYPADSCVHRLFEAQAALRPQAMAVSTDGKTITYGELNARANQLARLLTRCQVGSGSLVGVCLERSIDLVVAFLAVLKTGAAYVPLDGEYPKERLAFMLNDTGLPVLLTQQSFVPKLPTTDARIICLDRDWSSIALESSDDLSCLANSEDLAYVMYTSGSTGRPKGVAVRHRGIVRLVINPNYISLDSNDRIAQVSNISFDAATFEIWGALLNGGQLMGFSREELLSPELFARNLRERGITAMFLTSALFNQVAAEAPGAFESLRSLLVGGEALDPKWIRAVLQHRPPQRLLNGYGPTENTTFTCCYHICELAERVINVPIGRPIANTQVYILDPYGNPVPIGVPGELHAGGDGLAQGYFGQPDLTSEKFVPRPFRKQGVTKYLYRTGDLARYLPDGNIEFLGRMDQQVKIRGFRIELGEIESVLTLHPGIKECVVVVHRQPSGEKQLAAYFKPATEIPPDHNQLREFLAEKLPAYMLPSSFVEMATLPLTANGKVDRQTLAGLIPERPKLTRDFTTARDPVELQLTSIWEKVLAVRPIGIRDRFFDLGGHSLLAVRVIGEIEKTFGKKLRLATIFQAPTIHQLAAILRDEIKESSATADSSLVEIQGEGSRPPFFLVHGAGGGMFWGYVNLSRHLGSDQPVYAFKSIGLDGGPESEQIEEMAAQYIKDLRRLQPHGPYFLGGYCFGGNVAYEMARQLTAQNEAIALLALFNCAPPNSRYTGIPFTPRWFFRFALNLVYWGKYFFQWNARQRREFFRWKWSLLRKRLASGPADESSRVEAGDLVDLSSFSEDQRRTWESHIRALVAFHPKRYAGRVHLFRSPGHPLFCSFDPAYGWEDFASGGVQVSVLPGTHEKILEEPCVQVLAKELTQTLKEAQQATQLTSNQQENRGLSRTAPIGDAPLGVVHLNGAPKSIAEGARMDFPGESIFSEHFIVQAKQRGSAIAVRFESEQLTYEELNARANQLAHYLIELGVGPEVLVGICLKRSLDLPVALLAVIKAGGAYLPLDPDYPADRLAFMLADAKAQVLLTQSDLLSVLPGASQLICLDAPKQRARIVTYSRDNPRASAGREQLAYVIYTSGSSGTPKGVQITRRSMLNHNFAVAHAYELSPADRVLQFSPLSFDICLEEIFPTWISGGTVVLRTERAISSPEQFFRFVSSERITVLNLPTAYWHELVDSLDGHSQAFPSTVRMVIVGGEKALDEAYRLWKAAVPSSVILINAYGATEATITTTLYRAFTEDDSLPIGRPIANTQVVLLDRQGQVVPWGSTGELCIGGAGIGRGYLHHPDLNQQVFVPNPFPEMITSERLYKTGDLARFRPDGNLEFLGRVDEQVKIRGYRIELAEIEAVLSQHPGIKHAVVVACENASERKRLVAYVVPRIAPGPGVNELLACVKTKLPRYMIPSTFIRLAAIPLTPAGKVDRHQLPAPGKDRPNLDKEFVSPALPLEQTLANIWSEVLEVTPVGVHDDFFDLGGQSLLAIQVLARVRENLGVELGLDQFFANPTVSLLAQELTRRTHSGGVGDTEDRTATAASRATDTLPSPEEELHCGYWARQLDNAPALLELPSDRPRAAQSSGAAARVSVSLSRSLTEPLDEFARNEGQKTFTILLTAFAALLHRYSGSEDIAIGAPIGSLGAVAQGPGLATTVPLRCNLAGNPSFREFLQRVGKVIEEALAHSALPFAKIVELGCGHRQNQFYAPLFQVMLGFDETAAGSGASSAETTIPANPNRLDLVLGLARHPDGLAGVLKYSPLLFDEARVERMVEHFRMLITGAIADPQIHVSELPLMPSAERNRVLVEWNRTEAEYPVEKTLVDLFNEQVARTPQAIALVSGTCRLRYDELHSRALQIANHLLGLGVGRETLVGIFHERSPAMIAGMLGVLMARGAYVPLDPVYPRQRLQGILEDGDVRVVLTQEKLLPVLPATSAQIVCLDAMPREERDTQRIPKDTRSSASIAVPNDLAYVLYTSGSTGKPKGVALEHRGAVALVSWAKELFTAEELSGVLASTSICFDLSVFEIFVPLCTGGKIVLVENALALSTLTTPEDITLINTVPSAMKELLRARAVPGSVTVVNLAGEPLATELVDKIYGETSVKKVYDLYGPTETTTYSTGSLRRAGAPPTIGRPLSNEQVYLLDTHFQPVPIGIPGELCIGGLGLARGYLNRPELTKEKFIPHPLKPDARLYRTGDLARWRSDGALEYLGRIDHQVKIRGFRIELGEIESVLRSHPGLSEAVVLAREDNPGDKRLAAYVVAQREGSPTTEQLQARLQEKLPHYMVPSAFVFLNKLPLTPNGKVDRKALPAPQQGSGATGRSITPPQTSVEKQLCNIWQDVLHLDQIGINHNFFDLGGHSLLAAQVVGRIRDTLGIELPLLTLFDAPTIASLAEKIDSARLTSPVTPLAAITPVPRKGPAPVSFVQERLWFLDQLRPGRDAYNVPAGLRLKGKLDLAAFRQALESVVGRHEALRTTFQYRDEVLTQVVASEIAFECPVQDFSQIERAETDAMDWLSREAQRPFELAQGPLIRAAVARLSATEHLFLVVMHHTICDGWSLALFFEELSTIYAALAAGHGAPSLPQEGLQYIDFAHWQRQTMQGGTLSRHLAFWKQALAGAPESIELPVDFVPEQDSDGKAARREVLLEPALVAAMSALAQRERTTPFMQLMAALAITLQKWTGQSDLVIGTVVAGRTRREMESMFGCFMNFLPIRTRLATGQNGREILAQVRTNVLEAQNHQDCPFERIVESVNPERKSNQNPLYNVALLLQNFPAELFRSNTLEVSRVPIVMDAALLELRFEAEQTPRGFSLVCEYRKDLIESTTIQEVLNSFVQVLGDLTHSPQRRLEEFGISASLETQAITHRSEASCQTVAVTGTFTAEPLTEPLGYWLKQLKLGHSVKFAPYNQVFQQLLDPLSLLSKNERGLNVVLLRLSDWQNSEEVELGDEPAKEAYLERNAREFISSLKAATSRNSTPWLVCFCPASRAVLAECRRADSLARMEQVISAELDKLGGVYQLLSSELASWYPVAEYDDPSAEALGHVPYTPVFFTALGTAIARKLHASSRPPYKVIVLDCDQTLWAGVCGEDGPKGVVLDEARKELQRFMRAQHSEGMLLCLCSKNNESDALEVFGQRLDFPLRLEHFAAWRLNWEPKSENLKSLAGQLQLGLDSFIFIDDNPLECAEVQANCPEVLVLQLPSPPELIPSLLRHCWAFDRLKVTEEDRRRGELYRQNRQRQELLAESPSLAEFLEGLQLKVDFSAMSVAQLPRVAQLTQRTNQFNCTAKRLSEADLQKRLDGSEVVTVQVSDRFGDYGLVGAMIYRTVDQSLSVDALLLSCRALGRGVEHRMLAYLGDTARARGADWVDVHFVRTAKNQPAFEFLESVGAAFKQLLNGGYVFHFPAGFAAEVAFHPVSEKPRLKTAKASAGETASRSRSGKFAGYTEIALQANDPLRIHSQVEAALRTHGRQQGQYLAPRTDLERQLCELWQRLLRVDRVGVRDDFFELGGHSLLAVRLFGEIEKATGRKLPLVTLFQAPTVEQLAATLRGSESRKTSSLLVPIQPQGSQPPLFLIHGAGGDVLWGYANLAAHLPPDQPIYGIKSRGQAGLEEFSSLREMASCYLEVIREFQPEGPYHLGGYCFGGNVAYEIARQLQEQGQGVGLIALIDSAPSNAGYEEVNWLRPDFPGRFLRNFSHWLQDFAVLKVSEQRNFVARKFRSWGRQLKHRFLPGTSAPCVDLEATIDPQHFPEHELKLWQIHLQGLIEHVEGTYPGQVTLLRTRGQPLFCSLEEDFCWSKLAVGGVVVKLVPGSHENVFQPPNVEQLAKQLAESLLAAQTRSFRLVQRKQCGAEVPV